MAIDMRKEQVFHLEDVCRFLPASARTGNRPHPASVSRWITRGLKAGDGTVVRLEAVKAGGSLCTSREAVERFFGELTRLAGLDTSMVVDERAGNDSRKLHAAGLK